jgi:hypothetical protein
MMRIYLASSWRNPAYEAALATLRASGFLEVYDFKEPREDVRGFAWSEIDPAWKDWTPQQFATALEHPLARRALGLDLGAVMACDALVQLQPCGVSAALELGFACGAGKPTIVILGPGPREPDLMLGMASVLVNTPEEAVGSLRYLDRVPPEYLRQAVAALALKKTENAGPVFR